MIDSVNLVVIVTYKSQVHYPRLREALRDYLARRTQDYAIVVENSGEKNAEEIIYDIGNTTLILPKENIGFSPAVNLAYETALEKTPDITGLILINPDLLVQGHDILRLVEFANANPHSGVVSTSLIDRDGTLDRGAARRRWNRRRLFAEWAGSQSYCRLLRTPSRNLTLDEISQAHPDIVSGAFMYIRTSVMQNGLDTRLPMYLEDQEICHRARRLGQSVSLVPGQQIVHIGGDSRRASSSNERGLRTMELIVAPLLSRQDWDRGSLLPLRLVLVVAAICRLLAVLPRLLLRSLKTDGRSQRLWVTQQCRFAGWFISWALFGRVDPGASLAERLANPLSPSSPLFGRRV